MGKSGPSHSVCGFSVKCLNAKIVLKRRVLGISLKSRANDFDHSDYPGFVHVSLSLSSCSVSGQTTTQIHTQTSPVLQCCVWSERRADVLLLWRSDVSRAQVTSVWENGPFVSAHLYGLLVFRTPRHPLVLLSKH